MMTMAAVSAKSFAANLKERGGRLVGMEPYLGTSPDLGPQLERLAKLQRPQFLFVAGNRPDAESILRGARALNLQVPMLGGDGLEGIEEAGPVAEGTYVSAAYHPSLNTPANRKFVAAYAQKYPATPVPNQPAAATYDAVNLLARAIEEGGPSRESVRRALDRRRPRRGGIRGRHRQDRVRFPGRRARQAGLHHRRAQRCGAAGRWTVMLGSLRSRVLSGMGLLLVLVLALAMLAVNTISALDKLVSGQLASMLEIAQVGAGLVSTSNSQIRAAEQYLTHPSDSLRTGVPHARRLGVLLPATLPATDVARQQ